MKYNRPTLYSISVSTAALGLIASAAIADHMPEVRIESSIENNDLGYRVENSSAIATSASDLLNQVPGAAVNRNGAITTIAQYRGLYGDRVAVSLDGASMVVSGPNAMDAPLSYTPPSQLQALEVVRGPAPVSSAQEAFGGHITAKGYYGEFTESSDYALGGRINGNWNSINSGNHTGALLYTANQMHKLGLRASLDQGDDSEFADSGELTATEFERRRYDLFYGLRNETLEFDISLGKNNTGLAGTPALPMDITAIDSDFGQMTLSFDLANTQLDWHSSYSDGHHVMDNFSLRQHPMMGPRETVADGDMQAHELSVNYTLDSQNSLQAGIDYSDSNHEAVVSNPMMAPFYIDNFKDVSREVSGVFVQWSRSSGQLNTQLGARFNEVKLDSGRVGAFLGNGIAPSGMNMTMMTNMANLLATRFNNSDRSIEHTTHDIVLRSDFQLSDTTALNLALAHKQRAPSYQEHYLWLPMQSTGGLADGFTYIGNLDLDVETANELSFGIDWRHKATYASAQIYYKRIDDYIQGTPVTPVENAMINSAITMFGTMMGGGNPALQYNNIDAEIEGLELSFGQELSDDLSISTHLSFVSGKRRDQDDDLYRIAPLNGQIAIHWQPGDWELSLINELVQHQSNTSEFNNEAATPGYGLIHISAARTLAQGLQIQVDVNNLTDKRYQRHLAGYNRVRNNPDIAAGERLFGEGQSVQLGLTYEW